VHGQAITAGGVGVLAENTAGGTALQASGTANFAGITTFSRSGLVTVAAGSSSATKTGVALTSASLVLAILRQDRAGVWVRSAVPNVAGSSFTVHLNKAPSASMSVAWFIVN
jgi:formate/nitrite transporter FocA (FNT family)